MRLYKPFDLLLYSVAVTLVISLMSAKILAFEGGYSLTLAAERDDNINLDVDSPTAATLQRTTLALDYSHDGALLQSDFDISYTNRNFSDDVRLEQNATQAKAFAKLTLLPRRISWSAEAFATQLQIDAAQGETIENLTQSKSFSTGPDINYQIGANDFTYRGRYESNEVDTNLVADRDFLLHRIEWRRLISATFSAWVYGQNRAADSKNDSLDNDEEELGFGFTKVFPRAVLSVTAGETTLDFDNGAESTSDRYSFDLSFALNPDSQILLSVSQLVGDQTNDITSPLQFGLTVQGLIGQNALDPSLTLTDLLALSQNSIVRSAISEDKLARLEFSTVFVDADFRLSVFRSERRLLSATQIVTGLDPLLLGGSDDFERKGYQFRLLNDFGWATASLNFSASTFSSFQTSLSSDLSDMSLNLERQINESVAVGGLVRQRTIEQSTQTSSAESSLIGAYLRVVR